MYSTTMCVCIVGTASVHTALRESCHTRCQQNSMPRSCGCGHDPLGPVASFTSTRPTMDAPGWQAYKAQKEAWVTGHTGSTVLYICAVCSTTLVSYAAWLVLRQHAVVIRHPLVADFVVLIAPLTMACTLLANYVSLLLSTLLFLSLFVYATQPRLPFGLMFNASQLSSYSDALALTSAEESDSSAPTPSKQDLNEKKPVKRIRKPFLTVYRAYLMVLTVLCILAVDFPVFPRVFAKCETWGTSLVRRFILAFNTDGSGCRLICFFTGCGFAAPLIHQAPLV
mgnify:CR=1 FL=1